MEIWDQPSDKIAYINILLLQDNQAVLQEYENTLQKRSVHHLGRLCRIYDFKISESKARVITSGENSQ